MSALCECGCGKLAPLAPQTRTERGQRKGEPVRFIWGHSSRSRIPDKERFLGYVTPEPNTGCWLWCASTNGYGYGQFSIGGRNVGAHRAAWEFFRGPVPADTNVLHRCDVPACVNPDHLFLGTQADNNADRDQKGRHRTPRGEESPNAKLTVAQVQHIRAAHHQPARILAQKYGVSRVTISTIRRRETWRHV